jgi:NAD(P)-dependent dehydrogenase (short-subunit alcohol dehydrogenase family)
VRLARAALPHLEASGRGSIVAISSVSGREADFAAGPYATMKTAILGYIKGLAHQLAGRGVRANVVSPGNTYFEGGFWHGAEQNLPDLYASQLAQNPTGRMGVPEEMARAVVFLSSPASAFTTGAHLLVDGALSRGVQV